MNKIAVFNTGLFVNNLMIDELSNCEIGECKYLLWDFATILNKAHILINNICIQMEMVFIIYRQKIQFFRNMHFTHYNIVKVVGKSIKQKSVDNSQIVNGDYFMTLHTQLI